tara:strand:+ start:844 stop:1065 length:222 start_codon:yes stop_codon:yes gene_type:complete
MSREFRPLPETARESEPLHGMMWSRLSSLICSRYNRSKSVVGLALKNSAVLTSLWIPAKKPKLHRWIALDSLN